jgi:hypothetical protein
VDGDGFPDVLFPHLLGEVVRIYWGDGQATLGAYTDVSGGRTDRPPAVGDVDGDGQADLVLALVDAGSFRLLRGRGDRTFGPPEDVFQGPAPIEAQLVDIDGDRQLDLLFRDTRYPDLLWRRGDGRGGFAAHQVLWSSPSSKLLGLLWAGRDATGTSVAVWLQDEIRTLQVRGAAVVTGAAQVSTPSSSFPPLAWVQDGSVVGWYQTHNESLFRWLEQEKGWCVAGTASDASAMGDLDRDGVPELLISRTCAGCTSNHVLMRTGG